MIAAESDIVLSSELGKAAQLANTPPDRLEAKHSQVTGQTKPLTRIAHLAKRLAGDEEFLVALEFYRFRPAPWV